MNQPLIPTIRLGAAAALSACLYVAAGCGPAPAAPTSAVAPTAETMVIATVSAGVASDAAVSAAGPTATGGEPTALAAPSVPAAPPQGAADALDACADPTIAALGTGWNFVLATEPTAGAQVQSGFPLRGCGDVFEAMFGWRLRDALGAILVDDNATMSCGTGCVGTFDLAVSYPPQAQPALGSLELYTTSMADGAEQLRAVIPVVLH
ncbi:MAG: Gmad2 immunoglobulin-like domain-containing protein [Ardenticatenales bacterium]